MSPSAATGMLEKVLIANRGEVAIRIAQAAAELGSGPPMMRAMIPSWIVAPAGRAASSKPRDSLPRAAMLRGHKIYERRLAAPR